jgi:hypothetical protein
MYLPLSEWMEIFLWFGALLPMLGVPKENLRGVIGSENVGGGWGDVFGPGAQWALFTGMGAQPGQATGGSGAGGGGGGVPLVPPSSASEPLIGGIGAPAAGAPAAGAGAAAGAAAAAPAATTWQQWLARALGGAAALAPLFSNNDPGQGVLPGQPAPESALPAIFHGNEPGFAGLPALTEAVRNPYQVPPAALNRNLEALNVGFDVARQRAGANILGSGAAEGGVARGEMANIDVARASAISDTVREWDQFVTQLGDERIREMLLPWLALYNQAYGIASGVPTPPPQSSTTEDYLQAAQRLAQAFL